MKRLLSLLLVACLAVFSTGCASTLQGTPPPGTYDAQGTKLWNADQFLKDLKSLSTTAINLNATQGTLHLSDKDTDYVRQFSLSAGAGLNASATAVSNVQVIQQAFEELNRNLSPAAKANKTFSVILATIQASLNAFPQSQEENLR